MKYLVFVKFFTFSGILVIASISNTQAIDKGYPLGNDETCSVWWAEIPYQIMTDDPVPAGKIRPMQLAAARNEYESVQLILSPHGTLKNLAIEIESIKSESGAIIDKNQITVRKVKYVHVIRPTDDYGKVGWYPDPLPLFEGPMDLQAGKNNPFLITIHIPEEAAAGTYKGSIDLNTAGWSKTIPFAIEVWNFRIPDRPLVRSAFGIGTEQIKEYHNLESEKEIKEVTDKYYQMMRQYGIGPTDPFSLYPMKVQVEGLNWTGGIFSEEYVVSGNKALKVVDDEIEANIEAHTNALIGVDPHKSYVFTWHARTAQSEQRYCVMLQCYDENKQLLPFENRMDEFIGNGSWKQDTMATRPFREEIKYVSAHLFPAFRDRSGTYTGTTWFDDVQLISTEDNRNLISQGDFEVDPEDLDLSVNFEEFDQAGKKYLDELGFTAYNLSLEGLPSGTFFSQRNGVFNGFMQGTAEYDYLMQQYLTIVQDHLEEMGWLGREYVYWFDEPNTENYAFVREGMEIIHRAAPKITRFITEHQPGPDIMDVTEISCTVIGQLDPDVIKDLVTQGREFWSYVCCCPKAPYLSLFIDHDAINMRMWLWLSYKFKMKGILVWSANYWNSRTASPANYLQNPWEDPMSYTVGYGLPFGKQSGWGNGDGRFFYPPNRDPNDHSKKFMEGPVPCLRLENIRDGIEDYAYLKLLEEMVSHDDGKHKKEIKEALKVLALPESLVSGPVYYNKDPQALIQYRNRIGELLDNFSKNR